MQTVTQQFREQEYSGEALFNSILTINDALVPVSQIASITIKSPIIDTSVETFYIGTFISQSVTIKFKNLDGLDIRSKNKVHLEIGQSVEDVFTYVPIGEYLIDDLAENYQETCEITCLDYSIKFKPNIDISACYTNGKATAETIARYICEYFGVELDDSNFNTLPNLDVEIGVYDNTISGKQWLSYIAEINGCNLKMSRDAKLKFIPFVKNEADVEIDATKGAEWELGEKFQLTKIVYFDAVRNFTEGGDEGNTLFIRQDNPFVIDASVIKNMAYEMIYIEVVDDIWDSEEINNTINNNKARFRLDGNLRQDKTTGKNLYSISNYSGTFKNLDITVEDGIITINGTSNGAGTLTIQSLINNSLNGTYTLSTNYISGTISANNGGNINIRNASDSSIIQGTQTNLKNSQVSTTVNLNTGNIAFGIYVLNNITFNNFKIKPQLELSSVVTEYEPFTYGASPNPNYPQEIQVVKGTQTITIEDENNNTKQFVVNLGNIELCEIENDGDYIYDWISNQNGRWYKYKNIGKIILNGSETWTSIQMENTYGYIIPLSNVLSPRTTGQIPSAYCNYYIVTSPSSNWDTLAEKSNFTIINSNTNDSYLRFTNGDTTNELETFKTWLSTHNIVVYYILKSQIIEEITDATLISQLEAINDFYLFDGNNSFTINSEFAPVHLQIFYNIGIDFTIWSVKTKNYGDISLDAWDIIKYNLDNEEYYTYNDNTLTYEMNIVSEVNTQIPTKQKEITTNVVGGDIDTKIKMLKTTLDYVKNEISLLVQETSGLTEQTNQLVMDILSTQNIFQITGGVNLINNSQFLFPDTNDEFWKFTNNGNNPYNNMGDGYDANLIGKTTAISKIKLRDTILESSSTNIANLIQNQQYTLNYSYTQDNLTTTTVQLIENISGNVIFEKTYNEQVSNITNETFTFVAEDTSYTFKVTTTTTSGNISIGYFNIYDLMLNSGDKKTWTPAKSEVYSTVVKMSQMGLSVFATGSNIVTLLTSQGFQVRKYANGQIGIIITEFTDTGMITGDIQSNSIATGKYISTEMTINGREHHVEYFRE